MKCVKKQSVACIDSWRRSSTLLWCQDSRRRVYAVVDGYTNCSERRCIAATFFSAVRKKADELCTVKLPELEKKKGTASLDALSLYNLASDTRRIGFGASLLHGSWAMHDQGRKKFDENTRAF